MSAFGAEYETSDADTTVAVLDVGGSHATLAIINSNGRPFIRDMTYAGDGIIQQIAMKTDMSTDAVMDILSGDSTAAQTGLHGSLESAGRKLIADVAETLRYYAAQAKSRRVDRMFVCGGFALAAGFIELLKGGLGVETVLWNPFDKMRCDAGRQCEEMLAKRGPAMAVAAGLAMRSI